MLVPTPMGAFERKGCHPVGLGGSWGFGANGGWGFKLWRVFLQGAGGAALIDVGGAPLECKRHARCREKVFA